MVFRGGVYLGALVLVISVLGIYAPPSPPASPNSGGRSPGRKSSGNGYLARSKSSLKKFTPIDSKQLMKISVPPPVANPLCEWNKVFNNHPDMSNACTNECLSLSRAGENLIRSHPENRSLRYTCHGIQTGVCEIVWKHKDKHQISCKCRKERKSQRDGKTKVSDTFAATCRYKLGALEVTGNAEIVGSKAANAIHNWARGSGGLLSKTKKKGRSKKGSGSGSDGGSDSGNESS